MEAVHEQKLVHRDIKPSNIMVRLKDEGRLSAKIIDLGLVKGVAEPGAESTISALGGFAGTPAFASPEQFVGTGVDIRSDLYSLGVALWEMLAGQVPFRGSPSELMRLHQQAPLPVEQLKGLPQSVLLLLEVLLEKAPAQRFQEPAELLSAISLVTAATNGGRSIALQELTKISGESLTAVQKTGKFSEPVRRRQGLRRAQSSRYAGQVKALFRSSRIRLLAWLLGGLLIGVIVTLAVNGFFSVKHPAAKSPASRSVLISVPEKSIAVLPFENISPNKDDAYFADGVQDEILNNLAKIAQLKVISRTSVMQYRGDNKRDLRQIASALGVANVLEGTVRREGNHVRVSTELVDARNDNTIWADSYDRDLTDIFSIQSEIAQKVASGLRAQLSPEERKDIGEKPTDNLEAYDFYLQAKQLLVANYWASDTSEKENYTKGISLLEEAIQKDNKFALAYCLLAKAHDILYADDIDRTPARRALGDSAVDKAFTLRPDLPEVHLAMASHRYCCYRDFERASVQVAIAAQALPNNPDLLNLSALINRIQGGWEVAVADLEKATILDPRNLGFLGNLAVTYNWLRRYRDAERIFDQLVALDPDQPEFLLKKKLNAYSEKADVRGARAAFESLPSSMKDDPGITGWHVYLAMCGRDFAAAEQILNENPNGELDFNGTSVPRQIYALWLEFLQGNHPTMEQFGGAREQLYKKIEEDPTDPYLLTSLAMADVALGRKEDAMREGRRAMELRPISQDAFEGPTIATYIAMVYAVANQLDSAFAQLNILVKIPGFLDYGNLKTNPAWDPLRKDPRFDKLLAELAPRG